MVVVVDASVSGALVAGVEPDTTGTGAVPASEDVAAPDSAPAVVVVDGTVTGALVAGVEVEEMNGACFTMYVPDGCSAY